MPIYQIQGGGYTTWFSGKKTGVPTGTSSPRGTASETGASTQFGTINRPNSSSASAIIHCTWQHDSGYVAKHEIHYITMTAYSSWSGKDNEGVEHRGGQLSNNSTHDTMHDSSITCTANGTTNWQFFCQTGGQGNGVPSTATLCYNIKLMSSFIPTWTVV